MKVLKWCVIVWGIMLLLEDMGYNDPQDKDYFVPDLNIPYDSVAQAKQDSIVRRATIKKDTTPYRGHWVDLVK